MPKIKEVYDRLCEIKGLLGDLKFLVLQERDDITTLNLAGLGERRNAIEKLNGRINELNVSTAAVITVVCREAGIIDNQSLSLFITTVPKPDREQFVSLQNAILKLSFETDNALKVNSGVLEDSLAFTNQSMNTFAGLLKSTSTYGHAGRYVESIGRSVIVNREI